MNSGSTSSDRQADTHTPHWMHAIAWVMSSIASAGTMYSLFSGGSSAGSSHGTTRRIFFQCTASMSMIRSLITGMFPIGSTMIAPSRAFSAASPMLGVAGERGLAVDADAARAADGGLARAADADRAVLAVLHLEDAVEHRALGREVHAVVLPVGGLPRLGVEAADLQLCIRPSSVRPFLWLPLCQSDLGVGHLGLVAVGRDVDVLEPLLVVALREVGAVLGAAALLALERGRPPSPRRCRA